MNIVSNSLDPGHAERTQHVCQNFENMAFDYAARRAADPGYQLQVRAILRLLQEPVGDALDMGCGTGDLLLRLPSSCNTRVGIDLSESMLLHALHGKLSTNYLIRADACRIPLADGSFNTLVSLGLIEYVWPEPAVFREMHRLLRPGGQAILCLPHGRCLARETGVILKRLGGSIRRRNNDRARVNTIHRPTRSEFDAAMVAHGFRREDSNYLFPQFVDWPLARWLRSTDNRLGVALDPILGRISFVGRLYIGRWRRL